MTVISGAQEPTNPEDLAKRRNMIQQKKIKNVMIHNLYESPAAKYDLALVKIKGRFRFNPSAWPICVPEKEQPRVDHKGNAYTLLGYGRNINNEERGEVLTAEVLKVYVSFFKIMFIRLNIHT